MDKDKRPKHLAQLQALAAIGQCRLMGIWDSIFQHLKQPVAQILLTRNDIADVSQCPREAGRLTLATGGHGDGKTREWFG